MNHNMMILPRKQIVTSITSQLGFDHYIAQPKFKALFFLCQYKCQGKVILTLPKQL